MVVTFPFYSTIFQRQMDAYLGSFVIVHGCCCGSYFDIPCMCRASRCAVTIEAKTVLQILLVYLAGNSFDIVTSRLV